MRVPSSPTRSSGRNVVYSGADDPIQLAALSRQLVHTKLAEADAQRRLRVSARNELELRQRLHARDERIQQLKEQVVSLRYAPVLC